MLQASTNAPKTEYGSLWVCKLETIVSVVPPRLKENAASKLAIFHYFICMLMIFISNLNYHVNTSINGVFPYSFKIVGQSYPRKPRQEHLFYKTIAYDMV